MTVEQQYAIGGLFRDANPIGQAPPGALLRAEEVVFRRPGMVEPRPGFKVGVAVASGPALASIYKIIPFDGGVIFVGPDSGVGGSTTYWYTVASGWSVMGSVLPSAAPSWARDGIRAIEARNNLYLTTLDMMRRIVSPANTTMYPMGLLAPWVSRAYSSAAGTAVLAGKTVAYRAVLVVTMPNGLVLTSPPSARVTYNNTTGSTQDVVLVYGAKHVPTITGATVQVKFYRSEAVDTGEPSDDLLLATIDTPAAATYADGRIESVLKIDTTAEANLDEALYTNPTATNGGIARANVRPPVCKDVALYQGSLFFANLTRFAKCTFRYTEGGNKTASATGIGTRTYTGTRTNNSNQITGLSSTVGLQVGQLLTVHTGWRGAGPNTIAAISGATLTMQKIWDGATDGAPVSLTFADAICIGVGGVRSYYRMDQLVHLIEQIHGVNAADAADTGLGQMTESTLAFAYGASDVSDTQNTTRVDGLRSFTVEAFSAATTLTISASHGSEYRPALPDITFASSGTDYAPESIPNGIAWTKANEPESHMLAAIDRVGHEASAIRRIHATRDAIWILKGPGDGLYRLSGFGELTGWRVDKFDSDTFLLNHELSTTLGDVVYPWTNKGAVAISDAGVMPLSKPFLGADARSFETELALDDDVAGLFAVTNPIDQEIIFGVPPDDGDGDGAAHNIYVLSTRDGRWSKWFVGTTVYSAGAYDPAVGRLLFGRTDSGTPRIERGQTDAVYRADREFSVTINTVVADTVTIAAGSGWTPAVGDLITRSSAYFVVTAITSATVFTVHTTGLTTGAGTAYEAFTSRLSWLPKVGPGGSAVKLFQHQVLHWDDTQGLYSWDVLASGSADQGTEITRSDTRSYQRSAQRRDNTRMFFSRDVALGAELYASLQIKQADARWRLSGMTLVHETVSMQVRR